MCRAIGCPPASGDARHGRRGPVRPYGPRAGGDGRGAVQCDQPARRYDTRRRRWRHLNTCEYRAILIARYSQVLYERHKVKQVDAPWAENRSRFKIRFEALVIDWLQEATTAAVAHQMELSWDEVHGIIQRAVQRGLERREVHVPERTGVDETSSRSTMST